MPKPNFSRLSAILLSDFSLPRLAMYSFGSQILATLSAILLQIYVAQELGIKEYGNFALAYSILLLAAVPARMGLDHALVRFVPVFLKEGKKILAARVVLRFAIQSAGAALIVAAMLTAFGGYLWAQLGHSHALLYLGLTLPVLVAMQIIQAALRGLSATVACQLPESILRPLLLISSVYLLPNIFGLKLDATNILALNAGCTAVSCAVAFAILFRRLPLHRSENTAIEKSLLGTIARTGGQLMAISGLQSVSAQIEIILLGIFATSHEVGIFASALRVTVAILIFNYAVSAVAAPLIAKSYFSRDKSELTRIVRQGNILIRACTLTAILFTALFPRQILNLFGSEFEGGVPCLLLLAAAEIPRAFAGLSGSVLSMTGHQRQYYVPLVLTILCGLICNVVLIPKFGALGAAVSYFFSALLFNTIVSRAAKTILYAQAPSIDAPSVTRACET